MTDLVLAFTGHRPAKLGGYSDQAKERLELLAFWAIEQLKPTTIISGMALGWDQAVAKIAIDCKIPFIAAVPFRGQESKWPDHSQRRYLEMLEKAERVEYVCPEGYSPRKMHIRNEWMVENSNKLCALWDGTPGGTANCVDYAMRWMESGHTYSIVNIWSDWEAAKWGANFERLET